MKLRTAILTGVCLVTGLAAYAAGPSAKDSNGGPRFAEINDTPVAMYIWSDKYVYQPGESLTLRYTVKPNDSTYPYTWVVYRQNNQTGKKIYLPNGTEEPTDIFGNAPESFQPKPVEAVNKGVLIGANGVFGADKGVIPDEPGMHTFVVQLRDSEGNRVLKAAYMKIGVVTGFETIQGNIESNQT